MSVPRRRIIVPTRACNGGFDSKFEEDPYDVKLHDLLTPTEYTDIVKQLNDFLKPSRAKSVDHALLAAGPLMVPLAVWGMRHGHLVKKRKRLLKDFIVNFNSSHETLYMRWNRRPQSMLTIETKQDVEQKIVPTPAVPSTATELVPFEEEQGDAKLVL